MLQTGRAALGAMASVRRRPVPIGYDLSRSADAASSKNIRIFP
jgi:hypothetical protein